MSSLGSGTVKLMVGKVIAMAVSFATAPLVGRLFTPADYGPAGLISTMVSWLAAFSCLGYAQAIPLSESKREIRLLVKLCLAITGLLVAVLMLIPAVFADVVAGLFDKPAMRELLWFVPVLFGMTGYIHISQYALSRARRYGELSTVSVANTTVGRAAQIGLAVAFGGSSFCLVIGSVLAMVVVAALGLALVARFLSAPSDDDAKAASAGLNLAAVMKKHEQFPKVQMWNLLLNLTSQLAPMFVLGALFSADVVGSYHMGQHMLALPMTLLGASLAQVFYPEAAEEWRQSGTMAKSINQTVRILAMTCMFPIIAVGLTGPMLFSSLLGEKWTEAGVYAQLLSPWILAMLISSPVATTFLIRRHARITFIYVVVLFIARMIALGLGGWLGGPREALFGFSAVSFAVLGHKILYTLKLSNTMRRPVVTMLVREALQAAALIMPAAIVYYTNPLAGELAGIRGSVILAFGLLALAAVTHTLSVYRREPAIKRKLAEVFGAFSLRLRQT